eukprot:5181890-Prymnesium_polylepis.1
MRAISTYHRSRCGISRRAPMEALPIEARGYRPRRTRQAVPYWCCHESIDRSLGRAFVVAVVARAHAPDTHHRYQHTAEQLYCSKYSESRVCGCPMRRVPTQERKGVDRGTGPPGDRPYRSFRGGYRL